MAFIVRLKNTGQSINFVGDNNYILDDGGLTIGNPEAKIEWTQTPDGDVGMTFKLTVKKDALDGSWEAVDGTVGDWTAKKVVAKPIDLTGTWIGPADTPNGSDEVTCKLKLEGTKVTGTLNDVFGYFDDTPIQEGKLVNNKISFKSVVATPEGKLNIIMKGTIKGNKITGYWEDVDTGQTGNWKAIKKEAKK